MRPALQQDLAILYAIITTANAPRTWRFLPRLGRKFSDFWQRKIYSPTYELCLCLSVYVIGALLMNA